MLQVFHIFMQILFVHIIVWILWYVLGLDFYEFCTWKDILNNQKFKLVVLCYI